ncbi:MAG TPA: hypothetical protein VHL57_11170, partial [Flavobacteriales bacterium]|nr:hypothetical protein [Flavobacteriales bacterium]
MPWTYVVGCYNCTEPLADFTQITDCSTQSFTITANIYDMGGAASLDIVNDGGAPPQTVTEANSYVTGPYPIGTPVNVTIVNAASTLCNVSSGPLANDFCGDLGCGPNNYTFCYGDVFDTLMVYQGDSNFPLAILFNAGQIEACCDEFIIYDGPDDTYPILYQGNNGGDMTGVLIISTNPDHAVTVTFSSDGSVNCEDNGFTPIDYTVSCLDCIAPTVAYDVSLDCANNQFFAEVDISDLGTDPVLDITNDGGAPPLQVSTTGVVLVGPFANGAEVHVSVENDANPLCTSHSPLLTNFPCPVISCGPDNYVYCYPDNWDSTVVYQSASTDPIALLFNAGRLETCCDRITVYDGMNDLATQIYNGNGNAGDLTGLLFISTNPDNALTIVFHSDGSVNCSSMSWPALDWTVACYDCSPPTVAYDVVLDCDNNQFYVEVDLSALGSDPAMDITNDGGAPPILATAPGVYNAGPFPDGAEVHVNVENDANMLCSSHSPLLTNFPCPVVSCGPDNYTLCHGENMDTIMVYQSTNAFPIAFLFNSGTLETCCDRITVYDGLNTLATEIYNGNGDVDGDMTDLVFISSNTDNALTVVLHTDGSVSCQSGSDTQLDWTVSCLDCTNPAANFQVVPDCIHHTFSVAVDVTGTGTSSTVRIANTVEPQDTLTNIGLGTTLVGPFPMDSLARITVMNATNPLCR